MNYMSPYSVKNSLRFSEALTGFTLLPNYLLVSFDIENLFTNIPIPDCLRLLKALLSDSDLSDDIASQLYSLVEVVLEQNFFKFNNKTYKQTKGLAMGCPLSPLLAELFLKDFESRLQRLTTFKNKIKLWRRYVDDIFAVIEGNLVDIQEFVAELNGVHERMRFTAEVEVAGKIPFLDLLVIRSGDVLRVEIYRKSTTTSHVIPFNSEHPISHKLSSFNFFFHRLLRLPLTPSAYKKELDTIYYIATKNNYPKNTINKLFNKCKNKFILENLTSLSTCHLPKIYFPIPFIPHISENVHHIFQKANVLLSFTVPNTLHSIFSVNTSDADPLSRSGVYKLECSCGKFYIGRTFRSFNTRYAEHMRYLKNERKYSRDVVKQRSTFASHVLESGCVFSEESKCIKVLHNNSKNSTIAQLETLEILIHKVKHPDAILNEVCEFDNDALLKKCISRYKMF